MLYDSKLVTSYVGLVEIIIDSIQPLKQYPRSLSDRKEDFEPLKLQKTVVQDYNELNC